MLQQTKQERAGNGMLLSRANREPPSSPLVIRESRRARCGTAGGAMRRMPISRSSIRTPTARAPDRRRSPSRRHRILRASWPEWRLPSIVGPRGTNNGSVSCQRNKIRFRNTVRRYPTPRPAALGAVRRDSRMKYRRAAAMLAVRGTIWNRGTRDDIRGDALRP